MRIPAHVRDAWAAYGQAMPRFLDHLATTSTGAAEARRAVTEGSPFPSYEVHPWPVVLDAAACARLERVTVGLDTLLRAVPGHVWASDPATFCRFYGVPDPALAEVVMAEPTGIAEAVARLDMVATATGPRCLEYNAGSLVGGWETTVLPDHFAARPPLAEFLDATGYRVQGPSGVERLFRHLVAATLDGGTWEPASGDGSGPALNLALLIHPQKASMIALHSEARYQPMWARALDDARPGLTGRVKLCGYADLDLTGSRPRLGDLPIHAAFEQYDGLPDRTGYRLYKAGRWQLFTGPATVFLSDKRNLALLSERADDGGSELPAEARELVRRALPWTRLVRPGDSHRDGQRIDLADHLLRQRGDLVLKKGVSLGGRDVVVGRFSAEEAWRAAVDTALGQAGAWIVQEYCASVPHPGPPETADGAIAELAAVWGPFVAGGRLAGTFLRVEGHRGTGAASGIINSSQGARGGSVVPLEDAATGASV